MKPIAEIDISPESALISEHGWQSWSPSTTYSLRKRPWRPRSERNRMLCYRPETDPGDHVFWGEGLLAIDPGDGTGFHIFSATDAGDSVPSIRAEVIGSKIMVAADGRTNASIDTTAGDLDTALARWADDFAQAAGVGEMRRPPTIWCSWYNYFTQVTEDDMVENIEAIDRLELPIEAIQLDDGYQTAHGDWLTPTDRFGSIEGIANRIKAIGRRAGIWLAPFLVFPDSELAQKHPDWMVGGATAPVLAGNHWGRDLLVLDTTHPGAMEWMTDIFATMHSWGYDLFKIDFVYAAAIPGGRYDDVSPLYAYQQGIRTIRAAIGDSYLLGCGAPILSSVGLVDAMRVSPDTHFLYQPMDGDMSQPSIAAAMMTGRARAFQHGRFWVNDPDCILARPEVERRDEWAEYVGRWGGLRASSDRIESLDEWGLRTTRNLLSESPTEPFISSGGAS
ncbi:MAG: alpha-galactosidase [Acidimicrobiia bacterium]|nr:alpha-galactosidase [Acidimicrobiia bacterium]